jgi:hypothetical protein
MADSSPVLAIGSRYSVDFDKKEISGVFRGYSIVGSETAIVIDSDGTIRFVMIGHISSITLLESVNIDTKEKKDVPSVYYG